MRFFVQKAMLMLSLQKLRATVRCRTNCSGAGSRPGPTTCNALFFELSMHALIQRVLLLLGRLVAPELPRCTAR
jgi:hypothetical protein